MKKPNLYIIAGVSSQLLLGAACIVMMLNGGSSTSVAIVTPAALPGRQLFPDSSNSAGTMASSHEMESEPRDVQSPMQDSMATPAPSAPASDNSLPVTNGSTQSSQPVANFSVAPGYSQNFAVSSAPLHAAMNNTNPSFQTQAAVPVQLPMAVQTVDPVAVPLTGGQQAAVEAIAQDFENSVGGQNQNPADPAYLKLWQDAQPTSDDVMRESLGDAAYFQYVANAAITKLGK